MDVLITVRSTWVGRNSVAGYVVLMWHGVEVDGVSSAMGVFTAVV